MHLTTIAVLDVGGPMGLMFGILATAALGAGAGYFIGTAIGQTRPATPIATTLRLTRERLASVATHLEKASAKLNSAHRSDLAGSALVLGRRVGELSSELGKVERKASKSKGASA